MRGLLIARIMLAGFVLSLLLIVGVEVATTLAPSDTLMLMVESGNETYNRTELVAVDLNQERLIMVTIGRDPQWSPNGRYLAFTRYIRNATRLFLRDMATGTELAIGRPGRQAIHPAWTPRGDRLCWVALVGFGNSERSIDCYDVARGKTDQWLQIDHSVQDLNFSPDGQRLLMRSMFSATFMGSASSGKSSSYPGVLSADWSPEGGQLVALVGADYGRTELVLLDVDAKARIHMREAVPLLSERQSLVRYQNPVWSPDGNRIAFLGEVDHHWALFLTELASGMLQQVTGFADGNIRDPAWSPDGRYLYAVTNEGLSTRILWWDSKTNRVAIPDWSAPLNVNRARWRPAS